MIRIIVIAALSFLVAGCNNPGKDSFELGRQLERQGRMDEALTLYQEAIAKEQDNQEYRLALAQARSTSASRIVEQGRKKLQSGAMTYDMLRSAQMDVDKALKSDPASSDARVLAESVKVQMDAMLKRAELLYSAAGKLSESRDWPAALSKLKEIRQFYPSYLDLPIKLPQTENAALAHYLKEVERCKAEDDLSGMISGLEHALSIQPSNQQLVAMLSDTKSKNTPAARFEKAQQFAKQQNWIKTVEYLRRVQALNPDPPLQVKISEMKSLAAQKTVVQANKHIERKNLYGAYLSLSACLEFSPDTLKEGGDAFDIKKKLVSEMVAKSQELEGAGMIGAAWYWLDLSQKLGGIDRETQQRLQGIKDKLRKRVVKKIAIMDFTPPTNSTDAGRLVTDSLLSYMTKNASSDVKILARDVLGAIIKEIEFGQAGLYDIETAKKTGKLKGTDVFIFGSVLQYNVEKSAEESSKMVNVSVAKKKVANPAYNSWIQANPSPNETERATAPPQLLDEDIRETVRYKVGTHKKTASVALSFRVVDVESGEVVITKTIKSRKEAQDSFSEGVEFANIPYDPLVLPPDAELLEKAVEEGIAELGHLVLSRFQNLQSSYLNSAELLARKGQMEMSVERYIDAMFAEEVKNVSSQISVKAQKGVDQQLRLAEGL